MLITSIPEDSYYVELPNGLTTAAGTHYHTTEAQLRSWAEPVLREVPLDTLLRRADDWLAAPRTATLWTLPALLLALPTVWATAGAVMFFLAWKLLYPAYASGPVIDVFRRAKSGLAQGLVYAGVLSVLAAEGRIGAVIVGLLSFVVLRWGLADLLAALFVHRAQSALYPLPAADQVLRALIVRTALQRRLSLPELDRIERSIFDFSTGNEQSD